jgi:choice-of-anchor B domain-containing protein
MNVLLALVIACSPAGRWGSEYHAKGMMMPEPDAGAAKSFMGFNVSLLAHLPVEDFPGAQNAASDICGYVSPSGREYALIGFQKGMAFVDVTIPTNPAIVGYIDGAGINRPWRDAAVVGEYAYIVSDGAGVGIQVADLTDIDNGNVTLVTTTDLGIGLETVHNVAPGEAGEYIYLCLPNLNGGDGLIAVDVSNPAAPAVAGTWDAGAGVGMHDVQVVTWASGPLAGRELAFASCEDDGFYIGDVTDKNNMVTIGNTLYPNKAYAHQGWLSSDRTKFYLGDELDELLFGGVSTSTTYIFDVTDPTNPAYETAYTNGKVATDHNLMTRGDFIFEANYTTGLRIYDTSMYPLIIERGHFDTVPAMDGLGFAGAWGVDASLPSGIVLVSDQDSGLFVLDPSAAIIPIAAAPTTTRWPWFAAFVVVALAGAKVVQQRLRSAT